MGKTELLRAKVENHGA